MREKRARYLGRQLFELAYHSDAREDGSEVIFYVASTEDQEFDALLEEFVEGTGLERDRVMSEDLSPDTNVVGSEYRLILEDRPMVFELLTDRTVEAWMDEYKRQESPDLGM